MTRQSIPIVCTLTALLAMQVCADDRVGGTYYTRCNIWYEDTLKIYSTNFRNGQFLPLGTKVKILSVGSEQSFLRLDKFAPFSGQNIVFMDKEEGVRYTLIQVTKHTRISLDSYFDRQFTKTDPKKNGGPFTKLTKEEQATVLKGEIAKGMSKDAVTMALGYPPTHKTPSLKSNTWTYWYTRHDKDKIHFKDDKVLSVED